MFRLSRAQSRRSQPALRWFAEPHPHGMRVRRTYGEETIAASRRVSTLPEVTEAHIVLDDMLSRLAATELQVGGGPAVTVSDGYFVVSPAALYVGLSNTETEDEAAIACRELLELLPFLAETALLRERPVSTSLRATGDFRSREFSIQAEVVSRPAPSYLQRSIGPFLCDTNGNVSLLPESCFQLLNALAPPWPSEPMERLRRWGRIRPLTETAGAALEGFLAGENVVFIDKVIPVPGDWDDEGLHIKPGITDPRSDDFAANTDVFPDARDLYNLSQPGSTGRVRYLPSDQAKEAIQNLKQRPVLRGDDIVRFKLAPESLFPEEGFDLSQYGERVIGIDAYVYRAVPYMGGKERVRDWFDWDGQGEAPNFGVHLIDESEDDAKEVDLPLSHADQIAEVRAKLDEAEREGREFVEIRPRQFVPRKQLQVWLERAERLADAKDARARRDLVLQILENLEQVDYLEMPTPSTALVTKDLPLPPGLADGISLLTYQIQGYRWLVERTIPTADSLRGALLADDMGLGKTLQVLCAMARHRAVGSGRPVLVVAPVSVLENWQREAERFFPGVFSSPLVLSNTPLTRAQEMADCDIALTSYGN